MKGDGGIVGALDCEQNIPGRCPTFGTISYQGCCLGGVGCDGLWLLVALARVGRIGKFGTRGCRRDQVDVG